MSAEELRLEERRRSAPFHLLLGQIGTAQPGGDEWFNRDTHPELGDKTLTGAWLGGDEEGVTGVVESWNAQSQRAAEELRRS